MKKVFKIIGIIIVVIIALLVAIPLLFQSQIKDMIKTTLNDNLNAKVEFEDVNLSLISNFPKAHVTIDNLSITNLAPFEGETLASVKSIALNMSIMELFKDFETEPLAISSFSIDDALVNILTDKEGNSNYDIAKESDTPSNEDPSTESSGNFTIDIQDYSISNTNLNYMNASSNIEVRVANLNHSGKGQFSAERSQLDTNTDLFINFAMDSTQYLSNMHLKLDAVIGLDLEQNMYTFKDNKGYINALPLQFDGYVKLLENAQELDITFENPGSSFKDLLALVPEAYAKDLNGVETNGDFKLSGIVKGQFSETTIPTLDITMISNNASFKYPDLPKRVENIQINTTVKNSTGNPDDTYVAIDALNFKIDQDVFKSSATIKNLTKNMAVNAKAEGTLNLGNISKAYPLQLEEELSGILKANIQTAFDMNALETNAYERIKANGNLNITDVIFSSKSMLNPVEIAKADLSFSPQSVSLNTFDAKTGNSDFKASGTLNNFMGFVFSDKTLQGNFNLSSNKFVVNDFMTEDTSVETETQTEPQTTETLKIPDFLDCKISAQANTVVYDNLNLKNVKGTLTIKDQQAILSDMSSDIFQGKLAIDGTVSTKAETPTFDFKLGASNFDIAQSFNDLQLFQALAPIAKALQGQMNSSINLSGALNSDLAPDLNSVTGNAAMELLTSKIEPKEGPVLNKLKNEMSFIDFDKLDLKDLKTKLEFADGKVNVKPFHIKYEDIDIEVSGSHGFDMSLAYNTVFNVPAKYLGSDVNKLLTKMDDKDVKNMTVPVSANIGGTYTSPKISTDLTSAASNLTKQLVEMQKNKLINSGSDQVKDLLGGLMGSNSKEETPDTSSNATGDSNKTEEAITEGVKDVLGGLFGKKKEKSDN
ncbi:AsmA family protein [Mangrovimonas sp. DI 80]|uniref:AsmA family protein n=1 Tax=Mangrovimonas sp. DI 80 TaxID=1779330 RepID=UPI000978C270|nr:AsmA family protein [Mangrovimonas sp. DI 80]OMP31407.1 hypothetical protein BKM32_06695 [Mangrovimonas sp. DI 80]